MNISHDGTTVSFKTEPEELFLNEKSGAKSNLLCLMDFDEWTLLKKHNPTKIIIQHQQEIFIRTLTNIHLEGEMLNTWVVTFSWQHIKKHPESDHVHVITEQDPHSPGSHSMRIDEPLTPIPAPHSVPVEQGDHNLGIQQEAEPPAETCQAVEEPSIYKRFAAITISNDTLALLQSIAHGRTMNSVIRELYDAYIEKKELYAAYTEKKSTEWGPHHD